MSSTCGNRLGRLGYGVSGLWRWLIGYGLPAESLGPVILEVSEELLEMDQPHVTIALKRVVARRRGTAVFISRA